jgi:hypothetical protein
MKSRLAFAATIGAAALIAVTTHAQQRPDFSGRWVGVSPAEAKGEEQTVKHDATSLTVSHPSEGGAHSFTYKLDGTESRQVLKHGTEDIVTLAHAAWSGAQLTITSATTYADGRKLNQRQIWSLDSTGQLVIDFTEKMQDRPDRSMKLVYRKQ